MVVEPESLCWMAGRMVGARDGATWAEEFARFPALRAVVRDDGSGLGRGVKLERARRHVAGLPEFDDSLDVFHTLRGAGRALRKTWGAASSALGRAEAAQKDLDHRARQGPSRQGHGTATNRLWQEAERLWYQATAAEAAWKQVKSAFEFFTPCGRLNGRAQAEATVAAVDPVNSVLSPKADSTLPVSGLAVTGTWNEAPLLTLPAPMLTVTPLTAVRDDPA